jgi:hypothetical protein
MAPLPQPGSAALRRVLKHAVPDMFFGSVRPGSEAHLMLLSLLNSALNLHVSAFWHLYERARA